MYVVIVYALFEWVLRAMDESFDPCRKLQMLVNTTSDPEFQAIYVQRVMDEDARVWNAFGMSGSENVEDACQLPQLYFWFRIVGTLATVFVSLPYCIKSSAHVEEECAESSLPSSPRNIGPPPIFPPKPSPTEVPTESPSTSSKLKQREYPSVTADSPPTPRLLFNP